MKSRDKLREQVARRMLLAALNQVSEIYVVMSTHPNKSAVEVHNAHLTMEGAMAEHDQLLIEDEEGEEGEGSQLDIWVETVKLME